MNSVERYARSPKSATRARQGAGRERLLVVTDAIAREVRLAALDRALAAADDRFGPLDEELVARAEVDLAKAAKPGKRARRLKPR